MGLLVTLTELLGRLTILTPLLEHFLRSGNRAGNTAPLQQSIDELSTAHQELGSSLHAGLKEQHVRLARLEDSMARVSNRLAEFTVDREKQEIALKKVQSSLQLVVGLAITALIAALAGIALLIFRSH